jgi:8-oxo-dGTP diphosphatase
MSETGEPSGPRPLVGVAVIVVDAGRVLLGKRKNAYGAGTWALPGGHLEFGESILDCARREVYEECGLRIKNLTHAAFTNDIFEAAARHYVTLFVRAERHTGRPIVQEPHKCEAWIWSPWPPEVRPLFLPLEHLLQQGFTP